MPVPSRSDDAKRPPVPHIVSLHTGTDGENEYLLTVFSDGSRELATRPDSSSRWGVPIALESQPVEVWL